VSPPNSAGLVDITVTTAGGTSLPVVKDHFKYANPTISGVSPAGGPLGGGTNVTVTGTGFVPGAHGTTFLFGKAAATSVLCASVSECAMLSPAGKGVVDVTAVTGTLKSKKARPADQFTYH
jgi:hypothetical protein